MIVGRDDDGEEDHDSLLISRVLFPVNGSGTEKSPLQLQGDDGWWFSCLGFFMKHKAPPLLLPFYPATSVLSLILKTRNAASASRKRKRDPSL
jgi:hypothetical protein